ncbi:phospholipid-transporting ATPase ABCA3-like isoform X2 [Dermacentor albipictus]|uniref:phospholipid-transporting ATPase ABCA3-like isoform X2 n=1 Tax=Dermacentor albipictus TaxID=60249 RepID=UPI0038FD2F4E
MGRQTWAVLWRTLFVQCIKRHYIESVLEVLFVLLLAIAFLSSNFATRPTPEHRGRTDHDDGDSLMAAPVLYSPDSPYVGHLIALAFPGKRRQAFENESALVGACESVEFDACVHFRGYSDANETSVLSYALHYFEDENPGKVGFHIGFRQPKEFHYEQDTDKPLWGRAYLAQVAINTVHITLQDKYGRGENNITAKAFPKPDFPEDIEPYRRGVFWLVAIVFLYPMWRLVARLCTENAQGLREYERLMGLPDCFYWTGQFVCTLCFCLGHSAICVYCAAFQKQAKAGVPFFDRTDVTLLFAVFAVHSVLQTLLTMLVTCIFTSEMGALLCVATLCVLAPYWLLTQTGGLGSLGEFVFRERTATLCYSALLPTVASYNLLTIIGVHNDFDGGATWAKVPDLALGVLRVTMLDVWTVSLASAAVMVLMIFYLSKVLPWNTAIPLHPLFLFNPHYWWPSPTLREPPTVPLAFRDKRFEPAPRHMKPVLHVEDLTVSYGGAEALKRITLQAFEQQTTVLVGRNGAGKTTLMNVLAGLQKPSSGKVYICGYDVTKHTSLARHAITYCPQRDMIFPDLTVWEHLLYIAAVKQVPLKSLKRAAEQTLILVNLEEDAQVLSQELRRGEMKRLSIGMAIIAKPKVVLIDEPTSGLDSTNTHNVWDILLQVRRASTLFLSTHDMTEADVLADRVVGLTAGIVVCNASPNYLKSAYGVGYKIRLVKSPSVPFQRKQVLSIVQKYVPGAEVLSDAPAQATIALHTVASESFDRMFRELEKASAHLGVRSVGLGVSTLKDIYLKLTLASLRLVKSPMSTEPQLPAEVANVASIRGEKASAWVTAGVLMSQRCLFLWRRWRNSLIGWLLPVLLLVAAFHWTSAGVRRYEPAPAGVVRMPLSLRVFYPRAACFVDAEKDISPYYHLLIKEEGAVLTAYNGTALSALLSYAEQSYFEYTQHFVLGAVLRGHHLEAWYNPYAILSKCLAYDLASSALLAFRTGDRSARFQTTVAVHVPEASSEEPRSVVGPEDPLGHLHELVHDVAHEWALLVPLAVALAVAAFVPFASAESCSGFMQLQLMTGISGWLHCLVHVCFDAATMLTWLAAPIIVAFRSYYPLDTASNDALLVVCAGFGALAILSAYSIVLGSRSTGSAYVTVLVIYGVGVPLAVIKVIVLEWVHHTCDYMDSLPVENSTVLDTFCKDTDDFLGTYQADRYAGLLKAPIDLCCQERRTGQPADWSPFLMTSQAVGLEAYLLIFEALLLFVFLSCYNSGRFFYTDYVGQVAEQRPLDTEVTKETHKVRQVCERNAAAEHALVVEDVHKWYEDDYTVCSLSLTLSRDECFGLLGVHGCGKTAVAKMLAGLALPSLGECYMGHVTLSGSPRVWQSRLGYCPQEDALMDIFSGNEILHFFARLRGVDEAKVDKLVDSVASVIDLGKHASQLCETYSAGTRRKLSTAVAIIGAPQGVILDDATSGVDMVGRQMIYDALRDIAHASSSAIILTSRSTEECEAACSRVGFMACGELKALGTMERIRATFAKGCTLTFALRERITQYLVESVDKAVVHVFPGARQADCREGIFLYFIEYRLPWSHVFSRIGKLRHWFRLESVLVAESSLDELFLGMARAEMAEDAAMAKQAAKDASYGDFAGDPWGREPKEHYRPRQRVREARKAKQRTALKATTTYQTVS